MGRFRDAAVTLLCSLLSLIFTPFLRGRAVPDKPSILVLKPCCLGDVLMATAALGALRRAYPSARITVATTPWSRPALQGNPDIDGVLAFPEANGMGRFVALRRFARSINAEGFDVALVLDRSPLVSMVPLWSDIPIRAGLNSAGRGFSLTHKVQVKPLRHEARLYLDVVEALGVTPDSPSLTYVVAAEDASWAENILPSGRRWVAVHPGGGVNPGSTLTGKRWPIGRFSEVVGRLLDAGHSIALAGGIDDRPLIEEVKSKVRISEADRVVDLAGSTSFGQLAAVLQRCALFLGNDTGPMHLAVAVGTPVVAVFGPSKPQMYGPFSSAAEVVYHGEQCEGCAFRGGLAERCVHHYRCMDAATVDEVWAAVTGMLDAPRERREAHMPTATQGSASET